MFELVAIFGVRFGGGYGFTKLSGVEGRWNF